MKCQILDEVIFIFTIVAKGIATGAHCEGKICLRASKESVERYLVELTYRHNMDGGPIWILLLMS